MFASLVLIRSANATPPTHVNYQGQLRAGGVLFTGNAALKFVIMDGPVTLWSNDGTSNAGEEPTGSVPVSVTSGLFTVRLGAPPMLPLTAVVLNDATDAALRVWVDTGAGFDQLSDQPLSSTPFALQSTAPAQATKPSFHSVAASTSQIAIDASPANPITHRIGNKNYQQTSNLTLNTDNTGPGGLDVGTKAANTVYYLYVVASGGAPSPIASTSGPSTGPTGFVDWTYIGAFRTVDDGLVPRFRSTMGRFRSAEGLGQASHTGNTIETGVSITAPTTAETIYGKFELNGSSTDFAHVNGYGGIGDVYSVHNTSAAGATAFPDIPVESPTTLYFKLHNASTVASFLLLGWSENPDAWK